MILLKNNSPVIITIFLLLFFLKVSGQERILVKGKIVVDSTQFVSGIHVINLNAEIGTTTNKDGSFEISAKPMDSIFFSSIQFEPKTVIVKSEDLEKGLKVNLREKFNELAEVQLDDIKLSGVLSEDITRMPKSIYEKLGWSFPKPRRTRLELAVQSANNSGGLVTVLNLLNGKIKQLKKAEENNKSSILVNKGLGLVGESFFVSQLGISREEIMNFLFFCAETSEFSDLVTNEKVLKLVEFFKSRVESFKELRELN